MNDTLGLCALKVHRVLVIEDEEVVRKTVELALQNEGFDVTTVADGRLSRETKINFVMPRSESSLL